jgi:DNA polymerase-3 subunit beta
MRFIVSSAALIAALKKIGKTETNPVIPVLENYLFRLTGEELTICVSDLSNTFVTTAFVDNIGKKDFSFCVECRMLWDLLIHIEEQPLVIEANENNVTILGDEFKVDVSGDSYLDFPKIKDVERDHYTIELSESEFFDIVSGTLPFTSYDELRPAMCGLYVKAERRNLTFVATDGHRLVKCTTLADKIGEKYSSVDGQQIDQEVQSEFAFIIARKTLKKLMATLSRKSNRTIRIKVEKYTPLMSIEVLSGDFAETKLIARLVDEKFPDYQAAIPEDTILSIRWQVDRKRALTAFRRAKLFANRATHQVALHLYPEYVKVSSEDLDFSYQYDEKIKSKVLGTDQVPMLPFKIGFNSRFLIEIMSNIKVNDIEMACSAPNRAAIVRGIGESGEKFMYLIMPVMLGFNH